MERPEGYEWYDNYRIAEETKWKILPYDPTPVVIRHTYPGLGKFGLLFGLIEWGFSSLIGIAARKSVTRMPILWRSRMVEVINARAEAEEYKEQLRQAEQDRQKYGNMLFQ